MPISTQNTPQSEISTKWICVYKKISDFRKGY